MGVQHDLGHSPSSPHCLLQVYNFLLEESVHALRGSPVTYSIPGIHLNLQTLGAKRTEHILTSMDLRKTNEWF
jgi:hypothetical protein